MLCFSVMCKNGGVCRCNGFSGVKGNGFSVFYKPNVPLCHNIFKFHIA